MVRNFGVPSALVYGDWGLCGMAAKSLGISLKLFRQRAPIFFYRVSLKVHWNFTVDLAGVPGRIAI